MALVSSSRTRELVNKSQYAAALWADACFVLLWLHRGEWWLVIGAWCLVLEFMKC